MVSAEMFHMLESLTRHIRGLDAPWGGLQVGACDPRSMRRCWGVRGPAVTAGTRCRTQPSPASPPTASLPAHRLLPTQCLRCPPAGPGGAVWRLLSAAAHLQAAAARHPRRRVPQPRVHLSVPHLGPLQPAGAWVCPGMCGCAWLCLLCGVHICTQQPHVPWWPPPRSALPACLYTAPP